MRDFDNIVFDGKRRYYIEDLHERDYKLENTTPFSLELLGSVIEEHSWGELLRATSMTLLDSFPQKKDGLITFRCPWSKQAMFSMKGGTNYKLIAEDLYINCNHTALHSCWFLQDLLDYFEIDKANVKLLIHRSPAAESKEVKTYIENKFKKEFTSFLLLAYGKDEEYAQKVIRIIEKYLDPILGKQSKSYTSFFLFDDYSTYYNYSKKTMETVSNMFGVDEKIKKTISKYFKYLTEFYKL